MAETITAEYTNQPRRFLAEAITAYPKITPADFWPRQSRGHP